MKHYLSVLILILIVACVSCTDKKKSDPSTTTSGIDCPPVDTIRVIENIDLTHAAELISAFLKESKLGDIGRKYAIGGTFPLAQFYTVGSNTTEQEGPLLWFCYNEQDVNRRLYLSVEKRSSVTATAYPSGPLAADLTSAAHVFKYTGTGNEPSHVKDYLMTTLQGFGQVSSRIQSNDVHSLAGAFTTEFGTKYCKYAFSFFNNGEIEVQGRTEQQGLVKFLQQPGIKEVRYYFGYDAKHADNKIRVILFGVNASGYNMCQDSYPIVDGCKMRSEPIILQKSIPPQ